MVDVRVRFHQSNIVAGMKVEVWSFNIWEMPTNSVSILSVSSFLIIY